MMSDDEKQDILYRLATSIAHNYCFRSTVSIGILKDDKPSQNGSGVCLKIGDKCFVATAGHVLSDAGSLDRIFIVSAQQPNDKAFVKLNILSANTDTKHDLGYIEIDPKVAAFTEKNFLELGSIYSQKTTSEVEDLWFALGFPSEWVNLKFNQQELVECGMVAMGYTTQVLQKDQEQFIFLDYKNEGVSSSVDGSPVKLPSPSGMSGCGFWAIRMNDKFQEKKEIGTGGFWSPLDINLAGIDCSWHPGEGYIKATKIEYWLEFIASNFNSLKTTIESKFS